MPVSLQHVIGTISILILTISVGLSFSVVTSFVQTDINKKELSQVAEYVSLNMIEIATLTNSSNYAPITVVKTIKLPTQVGDRAYTVELVDATGQGKGYLVRASLASRPSVSVDAIIPFNSTAAVSQVKVATTSTSPFGGTIVPDSKPPVTYTNKLYGGNNAVVWARQEGGSVLWMGIGTLP